MGKYDKAAQTARSIRESVREGISWDALEEDLQSEKQRGREETDKGLSSSEMDELSENADLGPGAPPLPESVNGLAEVVGELKTQLMHLVKANEALEKDNENAVMQVAEANRERDLLIKRIRRVEDDTTSAEDLRAEIDQLQKERDTLASKIHEISHSLAASEQRVQETSELLDQFRVERNDASAEAACLDSQFSRAMKVLEELRSEIAEDKDREEELTLRLERLQNRYDKAVQERGSFKSELVESRNALEEVRQSILTASKESQAAFYKS